MYLFTTWASGSCRTNWACQALHEKGKCQYEIILLCMSSMSYKESFCVCICNRACLNKSCTGHSLFNYYHEILLKLHIKIYAFSHLL